MLVVHKKPISSFSGRMLALYLTTSLCAAVPLGFAVQASESVGDTQISAGTEPEIFGADYRLAPGDRVTIVVYDQPQLSGQFVVDGGGGILLPLAPSTSAASPSPRRRSSSKTSSLMAF